MLTDIRKKYGFVVNSGGDAVIKVRVCVGAVNLKVYGGVDELNERGTALVQADSFDGGFARSKFDVNEGLYYFSIEGL